MLRAVMVRMVLRRLRAMPIFGHMKMKRGMSLNRALHSYWLCYGPNNMVLQMTGLNVVGIACKERHVFTFFVFQADLPTIQELWSWLDVGKLWVLERSLEFSTYHVLEAVVGDDVVVSALVLDRYRLLH